MKGIKIKCIFIISIMLIVLHSYCLAGEQGYLIVKVSETFFDDKSDVPVTSETKTWFTDKRVKVENDQDNDRYLLLFLDEEEIFQVDLKAKSYTRFEIPKELLTGQSEQLIESEKLDQTKRYGEWNCYGVKITTKSGNVTTDGIYWLTKEVKIPYALRYKIAKNLSVNQIKITEELEKYEGYPVFITLKIKEKEKEKEKEIKLNSFIMEVKKVEVDPKIFEIPSGFKLVDVVVRESPGGQKEEMQDQNKEAGVHKREGEN